VREPFTAPVKVVSKPVTVIVNIAPSRGLVFVNGMVMFPDASVVSVVAAVWETGVTAADA